MSCATCACALKAGELVSGNQSCTRPPQPLDPLPGAVLL